jgi:pantoate--beta-alanine ligase
LLATNQQINVDDRTLVRDLNFPIEIVIGPTVRESDGLAMSSRNVYLSQEERSIAPIIYQSLIVGKKAYENGERTSSVLIDMYAIKNHNHTLHLFV